MARYNGIFKASANYEPQVAAPFDARELVATKADLTNEATWRQTDGSIWTYATMVVSVQSDPNPANNGRYILLDKNWREEANWKKLATLDDIIASGGGGSSVIDHIYVNSIEQKPDENKAVYISVPVAITELSDGNRIAVLENLIGQAATEEQEATGLIKSIADIDAMLVGIGGEGQPLTVLEAIEAAARELPAATVETIGGIKASQSIAVAEDGTATVAKVSTDCLVQGAEELILNGGNAGLD